jgi:Sec-independent protein secretion pathway component TatC
MFAVGVIELAVTVAIAIVALGCYVKRLHGTRWVVALAGCFALASVLSPADLVSTLIVAVALMACFWCGTNQRMSNVAPTA